MTGGQGESRTEPTAAKRQGVGGDSQNTGLRSMKENTSLAVC